VALRFSHLRAAKTSFASVLENRLRAWIKPAPPSGLSEENSTKNVLWVHLHPPKSG
jgi:hypothetical protein